MIGKSILASKEYFQLGIWNFETGELVREFTDSLSFDIKPMAVSMDENYVISSDLDGNIVLWDIKSAKLVQRLSSHTRPINTIRSNSINNLGVSVADNGETYVWKISSGENLYKIRLDNLQIHTAAFSIMENTLLLSLQV